jgi:putative tryptophan/tyrosine transport system substrate-binding protein
VLSSHPGLVGKWLELLKDAVPGASRIALLSNPTNPNHRRGPLASAPSARPLREVAQALGVTLQRVEAQRPDEIEEAFRTMAARRADALVVLSDPVFWTNRARIVDLAREHHLPTIYEWRSYVEAGGLMAYGANPAALHRRASALVDKILKGAKPADLPIEQPMTFELAVNLKTAQALGLTLPPTLLLQATEVIR